MNHNIGNQEFFRLLISLKNVHGDYPPDLLTVRRSAFQKQAALLPKDLDWYLNDEDLSGRPDCSRSKPVASTDMLPEKAKEKLVSEL